MALVCGKFFKTKEERERRFASPCPLIPLQAVKTFAVYSIIEPTNERTRSSHIHIKKRR